jgi:hypothetical protein
MRFQIKGSKSQVIIEQRFLNVNNCSILFCPFTLCKYDYTVNLPHQFLSYLRRYTIIASRHIDCANRTSCHALGLTDRVLPAMLCSQSVG